MPWARSGVNRYNQTPTLDHAFVRPRLLFPPLVRPLGVLGSIFRRYSWLFGLQCAGDVGDRGDPGVSNRFTLTVLERTIRSVDARRPPHEWMFSYQNQNRAW